MGRLIALYKAFSGGEWFEASLRSVAPCTDGAVVTLCEWPWLRALDEKENCSVPLARFTAHHPAYPTVVVRGDWRDQADQYAAGLIAIRREFGRDSMVLVVDTDEVWDTPQLARLRASMEAGNGQTHYHRVGIYSYLKSPLYRVWPTEGAYVVVGLSNAEEQPTAGRFAVQLDRGQAMSYPELAFHHFCYVRASEDAIRAKFLNTGCQERIPSDFGWFDRVWARLPAGENLHMTVGYEHVWRRVKTIAQWELPEAALADPFVQDRLQAEQADWKRWLRTTPPERALVPVPKQEGPELYADELARFVTADEARTLARALKTTVLAAVTLMGMAADVRKGGHILEIGSGSGGSMACLARGSNASVALTSVDPFAPYDEETHGGLNRGVTEGDEKAFWQMADALGYRGRVTQRKMTSEEAARLVPDGSCDIVFVDGNHSERHVVADLCGYWPKVRPGGWLVGHDYTTRFPGVIRAVDSWSERARIPEQEIRTPVGTSLFRVRRER